MRRGKGGGSEFSDRRIWPAVAGPCEEGTDASGVWQLLRGACQHLVKISAVKYDV